ncbi:MAG TPA: cation diffusion facilitator family transporter [Patescibacteria group bacterium]|nr:cation diffusion facilitator family transporter [Patescibacteria group bacterium]
MLSDVSSLALSLVALTFTAKSPTTKNTFGYQRMEILAALFNGVTLFVIAGFISMEAYHRLQLPQSVDSLTMMVIALIGLLANLISAVALLKQGDVKENINMRSDLHVLGDALSSLGAIVAGIMMYYYSWYWVDPLVSVLVAVVIGKGAWKVTRQALHVLMEGVPAEVDHGKLAGCLAGIDGVSDVHGLRIWSLTSGCNAMSCHLVTKPERDGQTVLQQAVRLVQEQFSIHQATVQIEEPSFHCTQKSG